MNNSGPPNRNPSQQRLVLGLVLLVAAVVAGAAWNWNRLVHLPDPDIVFHTEAEGVEGARKFLAVAQINTNGYDLSRPSYITKDRLKGQIVWRIVWRAKPDATVTNRLSVLASERGWFYMDQMTSTNGGVLIEGSLTPPGNIRIRRSHHTVKN